MLVANVLRIFFFLLLCSGESTPQTGPEVMSGKDPEAEPPLNMENKTILGQYFQKSTLSFVREMTLKFGKCCRRGFIHNKW